MKHTKAKKNRDKILNIVFWPYPNPHFEIFVIVDKIKMSANTENREMINDYYSSDTNKKVRAFYKIVNFVIKKNIEKQPKQLSLNL